MLLCQSRVTPPTYRLPKNPETGHVATIYKRLTEDGRARYMAHIRLKGQPRQSQTSDLKADAIRWAKQHETAVQTGRYLLSPEARSGPWRTWSPTQHGERQERAAAPAHDEARVSLGSRARRRRLR
jgi:hypothetical protein